MSLPDGTNPTTIDRSRPFIDVKTTTVNGVLKQIVTDYYLPNIVDGVSGFYGNVIQVLEDPNTFENGSALSLLNSATWLQKTLGQTFSSGQMEKRYKVRVPDIDYNKSNPYSVEDKKINSLTEQQKNNLLEFYNEYTLSPESSLTPVLGDVVFVTYGNLETRRDGVIKYRVGPVPTGYDIANSPIGGILARFAGISGSFLGSGSAGIPTLPPTGAPLQLQELNVTLPVDAAIRGNPLNPNLFLYSNVIDQFKVDTNVRYVSRNTYGDSKKETFCNILVYDVVRNMGVHGGLYWLTKDGLPIPEKEHSLSYNEKRKKGYVEQSAPGQYNFLRGEKAKSIGWRQVTPIEAQVAANMGFCVVSGGGGHVTVIRPGIPRIFQGIDDPKCAAAGGNNKNDLYNTQSYDYPRILEVTYHVYVSPSGGAGFYEKHREQLKSVYLPLEQQIKELNDAANNEKDEQKKYELKKQIYQLTQKARAFGSLLAQPTQPVAPSRPAAANVKRPSNASKA